MDEVETQVEAAAGAPETAEIQDKKVYELAYHLVPNLGDDDRASRVDALRTIIEERQGVIFNEVYPELFELAYPMTVRITGKLQKFATSYLGWIHFEATADVMEEIQQICQKDETMIRFLLIATTREEAMEHTQPLSKKDEAAPAPIKEEAPKVEKKVEKEPKEEISEEEVDKAIEELVV